MLEFSRSLAEQLRQSRVRIDVPDENSVIFRRIPLNGTHFNKPRTNMLVNRAGDGAPFLVFVDADLTYRGPDADVVKAFAGGREVSGWRLLSVGTGPELSLQRAVEQGLSVLEYYGQHACSVGSGRESSSALLRAFGSDLSAQGRDPSVEPTVGRDREIMAVVTCLMRWGQAKLALVVGDSGVGKTNLLHGVARLLAQRQPSWIMVRVDVAELTAGAWFDAGREQLLANLLSEVRDGATVLAMERIDRAVDGLHNARALLANALDRGLRIVGTTSPQRAAVCALPPLERRIHRITLEEPDPTQAIPMVAAVGTAIASHHRVQIVEGLIPLCVNLASSLQGHLPAKAINLLDEASSFVALAGMDVVSPDDLYEAAGRLGASSSPPSQWDA